MTHTDDDYERGNDDVNDTHDDDDNDVPTPVMHYTNVFHLSSYVASEQEAKSSGGGIDTTLALSTLVDASNTAGRNGIGAYGRMTSALVR